MNLRTTLIIANVVLVGAAAAQLAVLATAPARESMTVMASWKDRPSSMAEATRLADTVATGRVVKIKKADPIVTKFSNEPGGVDRIPVEVVTIELVDDDVKGKGKKGNKIEVFHTGHSDAESPLTRKPPQGPPPPKPAQGAVEQNQAVQNPDQHMAVLFSGVMEDPAYKVGEEYVLFVRKGPALKVDGQDVLTQAIISPEGRYRVKADQTLEPMSQREFAKLYRGKGKKELRDNAAKAHGQGKPN
jgi:hypothetical protein